MSWVFSTILSLRAHQIAKLIAVHELTSAVVLKEVAHGMVCLSESHLNFVTSLVRDCYGHSISSQELTSILQ